MAAGYWAALVELSEMVYRGLVKQKTVYKTYCTTLFGRVVVTLNGLNLAVAVNILYNTREPKIGWCNLAPFVNMF